MEVGNDIMDCLNSQLEAGETDNIFNNEIKPMTYIGEDNNPLEMLVNELLGKPCVSSAVRDTACKLSRANDIDDLEFEKNI
jgi:hypothetical protein